jgi:hypothetical protein
MEASAVLTTPGGLEQPSKVLSNLIYLASREAEDPERVRTYLKLAEKRVAALGHTLG